MSEQIPESIPTSQDPRSRRPVKKRALTPTSAQASQVDALFAHPDREIIVPLSTSDGKPRSVAAPPEIVPNVQGSSAGAGSGEFHVYKASRRREYERLRLMDEEVKKEEDAAEFETKTKELRRRDEERTNKKRARREKMKARKQGNKGGSEEGGTTGLSKTGGLNLEAGRIPVDGSAQRSNGDVEAAEGHSEVASEVLGVIIHDDD
ncbi:MAG: hypothetical protein M4579_000316 [Chaenotheca gracillima]|nr:MAG: hypothetical protein M4579_000316 [Chaenotheca gracillima]